MEKQSGRISFAAIDKYIIDNIVVNEAVDSKRKDYLFWGENNRYPQYSWNLYLNCATLQSIINGTVDFIVGNGVVNDIEVNNKHLKLSALIKKIAREKLIFGGYALEILKDYNGDISEIYPITLTDLRTNKNENEFYYSNKWTSYNPTAIKLPRYGIKNDNHSIFYNKGDITHSVYPISIWNAATLSAELEKNINQFNINEVENSFTGSLLVNFNNGLPSDEQKEEIERNFNEKFTGKENVGRIIFSYNDSDENKTTLEKVEVNDFAEKYNTLQQHSREQLFIAFRATPNLFGFPNSTTGFNSQEYESAFKLYNKTMVKPIQNEIVNDLFLLNIDCRINEFSL